MSSKRDLLETHVSLDDEYRRTRKCQSHLKNDVVLVLLSPRGDQVTLLTQKKVVERGEYSFTLPQQRCRQEVQGGSQDWLPSEAVKHLLKGVTSAIKVSNVRALGYLYGPKKDGQYAVRHGRKFYVYGAFAPYRNDVLLSNNKALHQLRWVGVNELQTLPESLAMSHEKYRLLMQAILQLHVREHREKGKLLELAHEFVTKLRTFAA